MRRIVPALLGLLVATGSASAQGPASSAGTGSGPAIADGARVRLEYTMTDDAGQVLDSNKGHEPFIYTQGEHQIVPGLEQALSGMRAGDEKQISVTPQDGYGPIEPQAQTEVPRELIPSDALSAGSRLMARSPDGGTRLVRVKEVKEHTVVIDLNHPLAGMTLHFAVKVLDVEPAPAK